MTTDRMSLDPRAFGLAAGVMTAVAYTLCAVAVAIAPGPTTALFSWVFHLDLTGLMRSVTLGSYFGGLVFVTIGVGVVFAGGGALYNRFLRPLPSLSSVDATHRVV